MCIDTTYRHHNEHNLASVLCGRLTRGDALLAGRGSPTGEKIKISPEMRVLKHDLDVMGITNENMVTMKKISVSS